MENTIKDPSYQAEIQNLLERECPVVNWTVDMFAKVNQECVCAGEPGKAPQESAKPCRQTTMPSDILYSMTVT